MTRHRLPLLAISLAIAAALAAPGCARKAARPAVSDTLNRHLDGDPPTLDPIVTNEELAIRVEELIFRPLIGLDSSWKFVPSLATSWAASSDGLVYDIRLDPKARWDDGTPVTSEDVAYTIERIRDPKVPALNWKWGFLDVRSVETPDPSTVIIRFEKPYAERLLALTMPVVSPRPTAGERVSTGSPSAAAPTASSRGPPPRRSS